MVNSGYECPAAGTAMHEAAAEIERLRAELAEAERKIELLYEDLAGDSL